MRLHARPGRVVHPAFSPAAHSSASPAAAPLSTRRPAPAPRCYASSSSSSSSTKSKRRAVTPFNDDGVVPWSQLSAREKTGRAAQQTFNLGLVVVGLGLTGGVVYLLLTEVFLPDSKVATFNRAVARVKADPRCVAALCGSADASQIAAFGEHSTNKWQRARPIASTQTTDAAGHAHTVMQFHVQGPRADGTVYLHLVRRKDADDYEYRYLYLDVDGGERVYLEDNRAGSVGNPRTGSAQTLFGINWGR